MKRMNALILAILLTTGFFLNGQEESSDAWVGHWINGVELTKDQRNYPKAIENYTVAIQALSPNQIVVWLNLINERGNVYFKMQDFSHAIKDFSFVLNHPQANQAQIIEALWGRSEAYLGSGKVKEFEEDSNRLELLQFLFDPILETKDYIILKVSPSLLQDTKKEERVVKLLLIRKEIKSEKDVTFTPSGLVIIKKAKTVS